MAIFRTTFASVRILCRAGGLVVMVICSGVACDHEPDHSMGRVPSVSLALAAQAQESLPVLRVYLDSVDRVNITCRKGDIHVWRLTPENKILDLESGEVYSIDRRDGKWHITDPSGKDVIGGLEGITGSIEFRPDGDHGLSLVQSSAQSYPGAIQLVEQEENQFALVNLVDIETYLAGVVGAEMYSHWHEAALRAQSIACRTYALYQKAVFGRNRQWDIGSSQSSQMYLGLARQHRRVLRAVEDTRGIVLAFGPEQGEKIFPAYYSAVCGGHTEDAQYVFGHSLEPLSGRPCPYCVSVAQPGYYRWPAVRLDKKVVSDRLMQRYPQLKSLEQIVDVQVVRQSSYGRAERLKLIGINGRSAVLRAEDFRLTVSSNSQPLRSSWYVLRDGGDCWIFEDGCGWGHGVGMCQCGAEQLARLGKDSIEILEYYYPQAVLIRAY